MGIIDEIPEDGKARQQFFLDAVRSGRHLALEWTPLTMRAGDTQALVYVMRDALRIGTPDDYVRAMVTADTAQRIADHFGAFLPTTKLADEMHRQTPFAIEAKVQPANPSDRVRAGYSPSMSDNGAMRRHTDDIDAEAAGMPYPLLSNVGKHWVITEQLANKPLGTAANYGWFDGRAMYRSVQGDMPCFQPLGFAHNDQHWDYSQTLVLVGDLIAIPGWDPRMEYDWVSFKKAAQQNGLHQLVSYEGPMTVLRQPSVPDPKADTDHGGAARLQFDRVLRLETPYMRGPDVRQWQLFVGAKADEVFGPETNRLTVAYQQRKGLIADGVVGAKEVTTANADLARGER